MAIQLSPVEATYEFEKTNGRHQATILSGGGGGSTGTPSISSVTDNGDGTITIQGSGFGLKDQAAPVLYDFVTHAYENGQENTFQSTFFTDNQTLHDGENEPDRIWDGVASPNASVPRDPVRYRTTSSNTRHINVDAYYEIRKGSFVGLPIAYGGDHDNQPGDVRFDRPDGEKQLYVAWWLWVNTDPHNLYVMYVENVTGTFQEGDAFRRGEEVIITEAAAQARDVKGWIHSYNSTAGAIIFEIDTTADESLYGDPNIYAADGSSFTAQSSGTTGNLIDNDINDDGESFWRPISPHKYARFWESGGGSSGLRGTLSVGTGLYLSDRNTGLENNFYSSTPIELNPLSWTLVEVMMDKGDVDTSTPGKVEVRTNGDLIFSADDIDPAIMEQDSSSPTMQLIGQNTPRPPDGFDNFPGLDFRISEVVQDKTWQRVVLADASTLSAATHYEIQRPTAWSDGEIVAEKIEGTLSGASQLYAFVFNRDGSYNETGVAV